ncbi:MAG: peptidoglycan bridge formation glycyltransferase FemA/FemB family protein [Candidatus Falkowbacteria bacterium]
MIFKSFLQSGNWEKFQQSVGNQTFRIDDVLLIKKELKFGKSYFYCPRVFIGRDEKEKDIRYLILDIGDFLKKIYELSRKENCIFLRIEPVNKEISNIKYSISRVKDVQPSKTLILNLTQTEEQLLKNMHQKTRYNIRLAEKKGVKIKESKNVEEFWNLMKETIERDSFRSYSKDYYEKMLNVAKLTGSPRYARDDMSVKLYIAEYEGKVLTAGIFVFYNDTATYLHGASTHEYKNVMAPYLLHWEIIKLAKKEGYKFYDFYGINEQKWPGVTRFKKGFRGEEINYLGTFDVEFSRIWYTVYKLVCAVKRIF